MRYKTENSSDPVVVVGGGWAGLAAAVELADRNIPITLIEAAPRLGGRARTIAFEDRWVDNGPHVLVGAYKELLGLLARIGLKESELFMRQSMDLHMRTPDGNTTRIKTAPLPAPLHMAAGCITASGLSVGERFRLLRFGHCIPKGETQLGKDISVLSLLRKYQQSDRVIQILWEPLCVAALNTPIATASAKLFLRTLKETFTGKRANSDLLIPRRGMDDLLPGPAQRFIENAGGKISLGTRVRELVIKDNRITGLQLGNESMTCKKVILAVAPSACADLLAPHPGFGEIHKQISALEHFPICTVYLRYPAGTVMEHPMIGIIDRTAHWAFDYQISGQPGLMSVIISGPGDHMNLSNDELCKQVSRELAQLYPHWPEPESTMVIREKRATFGSVIDVHHQRPGHHTPIKGCWLAGDYTDTGLPGTLEGAVRSGIQCAKGITGSGT